MLLLDVKRLIKKFPTSALNAKKDSVLALIRKDVLLVLTSMLLAANVFLSTKMQLFVMNA